MIKKLNCKRIESRRRDGRHEDETKKDGGGLTLSFVASTDAVDRYGDIVIQSGWNLENYRSNPIILFNHDQAALPIGAAKRVEVKDGRLEVDIKFDMNDPHAANIARKAEAGFLNAVSVGFQPLKSTPRNKLSKSDKAWAEEGTIFHSAELLEISVVTVPANPAAHGQAHAKDLDFNDLQDVFRKKAAQLNAIDRHIIAIKEQEESWIVEFAKVIIEAEAEEEDPDIGWGSGGDEELAWVDEYEAAQKDAGEWADLPAAPKDEASNPEDQDSADIVGAILGLDKDWPKLKKAFAYFDPDNAEEMEGYRLQIARMRNEELPEDAAPDDGELVVYWDMLRAAMESVISGDADIPEADAMEVYELLARYYEKFDEEPPEMKGYPDDDDEEDEDTVDLEEEEPEKDEEKQFNLALLRALTSQQGE